MKELKVYILDNDSRYEIKTFRAEYRNLMELIRNNIYVDCFGECGGMGRCATCLIEILDQKTGITSQERNEESTISRIGGRSKKLRLSCQILIDESIEGLTVRILDE
ncbi:MAG: 2Fe-2S iron-sulfur cluster-binding protein [Flavipsychrobacter sp.]